MMSSENIPPATGGNRKSSSAQQKGQSQDHQQQPQKCPRCDSSNTKFCYYNNYSLSQPRHFCKTCRRYWTKGGALRNVPIGGGCRKTKKLKPNPSNAATASGLLSGGGPDFSKFMGSPTTAPVEFHLGGLSLPRLHPATAGVYTQFVSGGGSSFGLDLFGTSSGAGGVVLQQEQPISLSSIESLSSINQEMHWKLQQQRLALIYGNATGSGCTVEDDLNLKQQKEMKIQTPNPTPTPTAMNLFQNLGADNNNNSNHSKVSDAARGNNNGPTEWFFDQTNYDSSNTTGNHDANATWSDLHHFNGLH